MLTAALRGQLTPLRRGKRWVRNHRARVSLCTAPLLMLVLAIGIFLVCRDPYSVRQLKRGLEHTNAGKYELAVECFDRSLRSNPNCFDAVFARGRAYERMGDFRQALQDFQQLSRDTPTPQVWACQGFCLSKLRLNQAAIHSYRTALDMGYSSPAVLNNIGLSCLKLRQFDEAEQYLKEAIRLDERMAAAHFNLLSVFSSRALKGQPVPRAALACCEKAMESSPPSRDLYLCAAVVYAVAARENAILRSRAIDCLKEAVAHGLDPQSFQSTAAFALLRDQEEFKRLLFGAAGTEASTKLDALIDPID